MSTGIYGGSITLASVSDGSASEAVVYNIQTNHEKVNKFFSQSISDVVFSPETLVFNVSKIESQESTTLNPNTDYDTDISLAGESDTNFIHLWDFLSRIKGEPKDGSSSAHLILDDIRIYTTENIEFKFKKLCDYNVTVDMGNTPSDVSNYNNLVQKIKSNNIYFLFKIFTFRSHRPIPVDSDLLALKAIPLEFGTTEDMAKFSLTANSIQMAVNNSKLTFDATNGLIIQNGGLQIIGEESEKLLWYDQVSKQLQITGNGKFTGEINATSGNFTGNIVANNIRVLDGQIGGFIVNETGIYSRYYSTYTEQSGYDTTNAFIRLTGNDGKIYARKIIIGQFAEIESYLKLGYAYLYNPASSPDSNTVFEAGDINIKQNGYMQLGNISFDGQNSQIKGTNFSIKPNESIFENITASGKITTAIFSTNSVQTVGGTMMFNPSYKVVSCNNNIITLDEPFIGQIGDFLYLVDKNGNFSTDAVTVTDINDTIVTISRPVNNELNSIVNLRQENSVIIGINSTNNLSGNLLPRGITITDFFVENDSIVSSENPKVFIGDLNTSGIRFGNEQYVDDFGYGLFSQNVYLTGSLTTKLDSSEGAKYAGVNTLNSANATKFIDQFYVEYDTSKIVFWAGSSSTSNQDIQQSPFQVTEKGSLYAAQGLFEGAIITKSKIQGADIYAARIHGVGKENSQDYGLAFYNTDNGIVFYSGDIDTEIEPVETFTIGTYGLSRGNAYFIDLSNNKVTFRGDAIEIPEYWTGAENMWSYCWHIRNERIISGYYGDNDFFNEVYLFTLNNNGLTLGSYNAEKDLLRIGDEQTFIYTKTTTFWDEVRFGDNMIYEKVDNGYNLYIQ